MNKKIVIFSAQSGKMRSLLQVKSSQFMRRLYSREDAKTRRIEPSRETVLLELPSRFSCFSLRAFASWRESFGSGLSGLVCGEEKFADVLPDSVQWRVLQYWLCDGELMNEILQYLKKHGECLDTDIAEATGFPLSSVRLHLAELAAKGEVMTCHSTRFDNGCKVESMIGRISGYIPKASPGRKSKAQLNIS